MRFRGAWWLIASALVVAGCGGNSSTTPPTALAVISVAPSTGNTGVGISAPVTATFNQVMNATSIDSSTFTLVAKGGAAVTGNVSYSAGTSTATLTPASPLAYNTVYTATITTGVQNTSGTALEANYTWSFTTATGPVPTVTSFTPSDGGTNVNVNTTVTAIFSEAMNTSSITSSTFTLTGGAGNAAVAGTIAFSATNVQSPAVDTVTFTPSALLAPSTTYTLTVTTGVVGATGSAIANVNSSSFTTAETPAPTVTGVATTIGTTPNVDINSAVAATFSEAMDPSTITAGSTFTLTGGGASVTGTVAPDPTNTIFTFTPSAPLAYNTTYTALITTGVDAYSPPPSPEVPLGADYSWSFVTQPPPSATIVASSETPAAGSTGVVITGTTVTVTFGAAMTASTINNATFTLTGPSGNVPGTVSYNSTTNVATFTPSVSLAYSTTYAATIAASVTDSLGGPLGTPVTWSFTTVTGTVPTVTSVTPTSAATDVDTADAVTATFSEPMNASTLTASTFTLTAPGFPAVTGMVTYNTGTQTATFTPSPALAANTVYTATITTGAQGSTGAGLASNYQWTFTTGAGSSAVSVSFGTTYQAIDGIGGSTAWQGTMSAAEATALYSPTSGLGLSVDRVRIDPEGSASVNGTYGFAWETAQWDEELANGQEAQANNPNAIVFATPWTPPYIWKASGASSVSNDGVTVNQAYNSSCSDGGGYCGGYLESTYYADYAGYLENFVNFMAKAHAPAVNLYAISMQNEPEENVDYESCVWTPAEMDSFVESLTALNGGAESPTILGARLMMPESDVFDLNYSNPTLDDASAEPNVGIVAGHLYSTGESVNNPAPYPLAQSLGLHVWATEHYLCPIASNNCTTLPQPTIADGIAAAEEVHNTLVNGEYNGYVWWEMLNASVGLVNTSGTPTYYGYGVGQFSKFIQPGYVRVSATANPVSGVYVSAYTNSSPAHYVIVAINSNTTAQNVNFTLSDAATPVSSLTPYQTTSAGGLMPQSAVTVTGGQFYYTLPAQSIITFVQ